LPAPGRAFALSDPPFGLGNQQRIFQNNLVREKNFNLVLARRHPLRLEFASRRGYCLVKLLPFDRLPRSVFADLDDGAHQFSDSTDGQAGRSRHAAQRPGYILL
jgi:hypothetical protein